jgi:isopenicillin-N epimerase
MGDVAAIDDERLAIEPQRGDRRAHLVAPARCGDGPPQLPLVQAPQQVVCAGQRTWVDVQLVMELACAAIELLGRRIVVRASVRDCDLASKAPSIRTDHRRELRCSDVDLGLGEGATPGGDPDRHGVDEGAVEIEDDGARRGKRGHRRYDTGRMPSELARHWTLDPAVTFLNHGSYGATPLPVLAAQSAWRDRMEREPVAFFARDLEPALDAARAALGEFVGADADDLVFVHNASAGVMTVLRSIELEPGDELVVTDHAYNAARNALNYVAGRAGARVIEVPIHYPGTEAAAAVDPIVAAVTARTRLALVDHVTSPTALVMPIERIIRELADRGVDVLVDGAHAPGMLALDLDALGAAYYTGNCHKWLSAPKGSAFLHVRRDRQEVVRPLTISHGANSRRVDRSRLRLEFDWTGTDDPSPYLAVPDAIDVGDRLLPGGWPALRARNRELTLHARDRLCAALGEPLPAPDAMLGSMAAVPLTAEPSATAVPLDGAEDPWHARLVERGFQVPITPWPQRPTGPWRRLIRVSVAPYNDAGDVDRLADTLADLRRGGFDP